MPAIAWVHADGLCLRHDDGTLDAWDSAFARQVSSNAASIRRKASWKHTARDAPGMPWNTEPEDVSADITPCRVRDASAGRTAGELAYVVAGPGVSAVCVRDASDPPAELRLFHTTDVDVVDVDAAPDQDALALSVRNGVSRHLALLDRSGGRLREITEGDVLDGAPRWVPGRRGVLVYTSAGLGRDAQGRLVGRAPFHVCRLDVERGTLEEIAVDPDHDLMAPVMAGDGTLWFLRVPYEDPHRRPSWRRLLADVVAMPSRLARAVFGWLDLFSAAYGGQRLLTSSGQARPDPNARKRVVRDHLVDAERAQRDALAAGVDVPGIVPRSWVLVRRGRDGQDAEIAHGVVAFDLLPDGGVVWTNGAGVWTRDKHGHAELIGRDREVTAVAAW